MEYSSRDVEFVFGMDFADCGMLLLFGVGGGGEDEGDGNDGVEGEREEPE
jgi:hypothetical protein